MDCLYLNIRQMNSTIFWCSPFSKMLFSIFTSLYWNSFVVVKNLPLYNYNNIFYWQNNQLHLSKYQFTLAVTFPCALVVGVLFCLCLTKSLRIPIWEPVPQKPVEERPKTHPRLVRTDSRRIRRVDSLDTSRISSTSTASPMESTA